MSADQSRSNGFNPVMQPFVDFWSDYVKQANDATREFLDGIEDTSDIKTFQRRWLDAVSKSMDAYMRSPAFLRVVKQNTDTAIKVKQRVDDLTTEIARNANIPTASDISGLFERLHCRCEEKHEQPAANISGQFERLHDVQEVILGRLGVIEERLKTIEQLIDTGREVRGR